MKSVPGHHCHCFAAAASSSFLLSLSPPSLSSFFSSFVNARVEIKERHPDPRMNEENIIGPIPMKTGTTYKGAHFALEVPSLAVEPIPMNIQIYINK